ncbi:MAG: sensor histidine kinase [Sphingomicrobium sp.]
MRFDDRLLTVLSQPASDRHDVAVRWRQLVDLVARAGPNGASPAVAQALESIRSEAPNVEEHLRAAAARAVAALPLPLGLLEYFAADRLSVSAPVLAAASLDAGQWRVLLDGADEETRRFAETLHPELAAAPPADLTESLVEAAPARPQKDKAAAPASPIPPPVGPSLSDVVAKIERRRRNREVQPQPNGGGGAAPAPPGAPLLFRWECGPSGEIAWVEGAPRGALIGRSIARAQENEGDRLDEEVVRAFAMRAPFRDGVLALAGDGAVSGEWKISGVPAFEPTDGRFAGYRGVALRESPAAAQPGSLEILSDPDSLRELVHEIKTPLNAIIGFAEIIDGQYLGPADRRYRERAAEIVAQARLLLGAIDDLDFAAQVHSARGANARRVDLAELLERASESIREAADRRKVELEIARPPRLAAAAVEPELADRLMFRLSSAVIDEAAAGERLRLSLDEARDHCRFSISRPAKLRGLTEAQIFDARSDEAGGGFSLRLVRGLARIAGGDLVASRAGFTLMFPRA